MKIRFHWHFFSSNPAQRPDWRSTVLEVDRSVTEAVAKDRIARGLGNPALAQYMHMGAMERA